MYIQENSGSTLPFTVPRGYSGSAFQEQQAPPPPTEEESAPTVTAHTDTVEAPTDSAGSAAATDSAGSAAAADSPVSALGRLPFLSSLLPPPRKRGERTEAGLSEWALLAVILFLLTDSGENDLLPLLLILLLWK